MQLAQQFQPATALPPLEEVRDLVKESLWGDWIIRIEHRGGAQHQGEHWRQWGDAFFAVSDPQPVMDAIVSCCIEHPENAIRLTAQKVRPESRLVFWLRREQDAARGQPRDAAERKPKRVPPLEERLADHRLGAFSR